MTMQVQRRNVGIAAEAIVPLAAGHSIVIVHGNGPQVGLLPLQAEAYEGAEPYPLDVLDTGTQGMTWISDPAGTAEPAAAAEPGGDPAHYGRGGCGWRGPSWSTR